MGKKVLVTGGAGFIGSHTVDALIARGDAVRVFDNLNPQVHGSAARKPLYLHEEAEFIKGDMRDRDSLLKAIEGIDIVARAMGEHDDYLFGVKHHDTWFYIPMDAEVRKIGQSEVDEYLS